MFLLTTPSSWQMIHTQHLSCQKIPPGVPPTLATLAIQLDCSIEESHHSHGWGETVMSLHNCPSPTAEGVGARREGGERNIQNSSQVWQAASNYHTFTPLMQVLLYSETLRNKAFCYRWDRFGGRVLPVALSGSGGQIYRGLTSQCEENESPTILSSGLS